jgi:hypothetical protein
MHNGLPLGDQRVNSKGKWDNANNEEEPRDSLIPGKRCVKPNIDIEKNQRDDELPRPETIKTMRARRTERGARDIDEPGGQHDEGDQLKHTLLLKLKIQCQFITP